jgi:DNA polymerase-3 subunit beta
VKVTCPRTSSSRSLASSSGRLDARRVQVLGGCCSTAATVAQLAATDMELSLRSRVDAQVEGEGASSCPAGCSSTRAAAARARSCSSTGPRRDVSTHLRTAAYKLHTYSAEDFPTLPDVDGAQTFTVDSAAFLETVTQVAAPRRVTSPRPVLTGVLVRFEGQARHGRHGLVPDVGQGDGSEGRRPELEAIVPARALTELARIAQDAASSRSASTRTTSSSAPASLADDAPHRRPVPELQAADPGDVRARVALPREEFLEVVRRARDGAAELAAAAALRRGRADDLGADAGRRRGEGVAAGAVRGEPLEIGFNPEFLRDGLESVARTRSRCG